MFTSKDVARLAGVSQSTVSYVMSGKRPISTPTRERVEEAIAELTYQPNAGARALAGRRTRVIGLVVPFGPSADTSGLLPFIETITLVAREHDHDVLLVTADEGSEGLRRLAGRALCDAIILMDVENDDARIPVARGLPVPVILIGVPRDTDGLHCVDLDFERAAALAVDDLAGSGHDRLVVVGYAPETVARDVNFVGRFHDAVQRAARSHGLPLTFLGPTSPGREGARAAAARIEAETDGGRCGVVVPISASAQPLLHALAERGLLAGRDLSLLALLPDAAAELGEPPISNISTEPRDVSRRALRMLFELLDRDRDRPEQGLELVAPRLTHRGTTLPAQRAPAAEHPVTRPTRARHPTA